VKSADVQFLKSRGWRRINRTWTKRGWYFDGDKAIEFENLMERTEGGVIPRDQITQAQLSCLAERMRRGPVWGLQ
jgi:hypothetical protein